ncbi:hypothetical protein [uncultured Aquimonas sp.]|jgi:hypothetical protein|uniref:hypothetical protein n=1 Tax=uncultured Aquimonas sp. TaxID=385483 RepID=UPI00086BF271|nr:hypothetical protein [uncultured Aquimonas sp.]ODU46439.1 MAG: hypothetical protein ABS96_09190 [Xanthomonadaceae bacterium SCN 69-123]
MHRTLTLLCSFAVLCLGADAARADARDEVIAAWENTMARGSYRMQMSTESRGRTQSQEIDVQLPSSFHMRSPETEMVMLPQGTWMRVNGSWMRMPVNVSQMAEAYSADAIEQGKQSLQQVERVGEGVVEGCDAVTYRYTSSGKFMGIRNDSTTEMAVCKGSGLPRLLTSTSGGRRADTVRIVYDFEAAIDIRPPG